MRAAQTLSTIMQTAAAKVRPRRLGGEDGVTLVEVIVAMAIFLVIATAVAGAMTMGLGTTAKARAATVGKAAAQAQFEEMKSRVFYVPHSNSTDAIDMLAKYYPDVNTSRTTDPQGWTGWYTSGNGDAYYTKKVSLADSNGITLTVATRFVDNSGNIITPSATYDSAKSGQDYPPSMLVKVQITASWGYGGQNKSYVLNSEISATSETSCPQSSNSHADVTGAIFSVSTGTANPYTDFVGGSFGDAHASTGYGCTVSAQARATGGQMTVFGGSTTKGATVAVSGPPPPDSQQSAGPINLSLSIWPALYLTTGSANASQSSGGQNQVTAQGNTTVLLQALGLQQLATPSDDGVSGYRRWAFINPAVTVIGSNLLGGNDDDECDDDDGGDDEGGCTQNQMVFANLRERDGTTDANAHVAYQQVDILPLVALTANTPSAAEGLVFVRSFKADADSTVNGSPGGISNKLSYSAEIGIFNPKSPPYCVLDGCYDLYGDCPTCIGPAINSSNPIQTAINLAQQKYGLQRALFTEWQSFTATDITNAMAASPDGTTASISADALMKMTAKFGTEVRMNPTDGSVVLVNPLGLQQVWLGAINVSVLQKP